MNGRCIYNANIVLQDRVIFGYLTIKNGRIESVGEGTIQESDFKKYEKLDAASMLLLPGAIDMDNKLIGCEDMDLEEYNSTQLRLLINEAERKLALGGITTVYHSVPYELFLRNPQGRRALDFLKEINRRKSMRHMINHKINLKYDMANKDELHKVIELIQTGSIHFLSLLHDHNMNFALALAERFSTKRQKGEQINLSHVLQHSKAANIRVSVQTEQGSYEMPDLVYSNQTINDSFSNGGFKDTAFAFQPASHFLLQASIKHNKMDAFLENIGLFAGDDFTSLVPTIFKIGDRIGSLSKAVAMATINPAKALGIDKYLGSIAIGKIADLILVEVYDNIPLVRETYLNGRRVIACDYFE